MEDSFRLRVNRAFGSLPLPSSSISSLWALTDDEINPTSKSNRTNDPESQPAPAPAPEPAPEPEPFSWSAAATSASASSSSSSGFRFELEKDIEDLDDEYEDEDDAPGARGASKPDDYDDEQWQIRSGIGRDCTLDYEEEEDEYDKQAIGKENSGDRVYMKNINDDGVEMSSCNVLPTRFRDFVRDPRANHLAARIRLKQDDEAAKNIDALHVSEKSAPDIGGGGDAMNPKSILKSKDSPSEPKSHKRVRFDPECDDRGSDEGHGRSTRDVRLKSSSVEEDAASNKASKSKEFDSAVPDYIRNPSRYTCYTFDDSPSDIDDKSNSQAYMSFLSQLKESKAATGTGSRADDAQDDLPSVTFISKKKSGDTTMVDNEMVSKQKIDVVKELMHRRAVTVGIASGDPENSDVCAMEEDEPEVTEDTKRNSQRSSRQYRKKIQDELE